MKKIVILGSGCAGTMTAVGLRKKLSESEWDITIIDNDGFYPIIAEIDNVLQVAIDTISSL